MLHLRRLARRGGIKRISGNLYDDIRTAMTDRLKLVGFLNIYICFVLTNGLCSQILEDCTTFVEHAGRKSKWWKQSNYSAYDHADCSSLLQL